ncbi:MAG: 50S ribosomal protein L24 [Deltaproteobacteria bacterium]|nr:50S ribosomal protein L24 [Deltaproteobacteria bacterium]
MKSLIRKNDQVVVITGKNKGQHGRILKVIPEKSRVIVEKVNMVKKHTKPTQNNPRGGIVEREASIHISNVMLLDPKSNKPTRVGVRIEKDGKKVRYSKKSGEVIATA